MADRKLQKAMKHYRSEFKGQDRLQATLALGKDDYDMFPFLKEKGHDFVEIQRISSGKLQVLFV
jgi:hypothetical protein